MKKILFILAAVLCLASCEKKATEVPAGLDMGAYAASTADGSMYVELIGENACKVYFSGENPEVYRYVVDGTQITIYGKASTTSKRQQYYGETIHYGFIVSEPGRITSRTSFEITADTGERKDGKVLCKFQKL